MVRYGGDARALLNDRGFRWAGGWPLTCRFFTFGAIKHIHGSRSLRACCAQDIPLCQRKHVNEARTPLLPIGAAS